MIDVLAVARQRGWKVDGSCVVIPVGERRHRVTCMREMSMWVLTGALPDDASILPLEDWLQVNGAAGLAWFAVRNGAVVARSVIPPDADDDEAVRALMAVAAMADRQELQMRELDLL